MRKDELRITVCQLRSARPEWLDHDWRSLVEHARTHHPDLVLLPEIPFAPWFARVRPFHRLTWQAAVDAHSSWLTRLPELGVTVLGSQPVEAAGRRLNEAYVWSPQAGYRAAHHKRYLPDDDGFWEASWYERGDDHFEPIQAAGAAAGFLVCTELWFMQHARAYGQQGVHLLATPRATLGMTTGKWLAGGRAAAVVAGAYSLSSNHFDPPELGLPAELALGGAGWVIDPDGEVLGQTTPEQPFLTVPVSLACAERAKQTYPRYVQE